MNGTHLSKVKAGDPLRIPAPTYNAFVDAARAHRTGRHTLGRTTRPELRQGVIVPIKNNSGSDRARYDILGLNGSLFSPTTDLASFQREIAMKGVAPAAGTHEGNFAVLLEPVAVGSVGQAAIAGQTIVKVYVPDTDAEGYKFAEIGDAQTGYLVKSAEGSARVVCIESGTGTKWAVVSFGNLGTHNLLSGVHADAKDEDVVRGDVIVGVDSSGVDRWSRLPIGANGTVLVSNGTDVAWGNAVPPGVVFPYAGDYDSVPAGYFFANGASKNPATYPALFAVIGYKYGGSGGSFNLPDTRQKFWKGAYTDEARDNTTARGFAVHGGGTNDHDDHPDTGGDYPGGQPSTIWGWQSDPDPLDHTETDNEPPHWIGPGIIKY